MTFERSAPGVFVNRLGYRLVKSALATWSVFARCGAELGAGLRTLDLANELATLHAKGRKERERDACCYAPMRCAARLRASMKEVRSTAAAHAEIAVLREKIRSQRETIHRRDRQLDALGVVSCAGGCKGGLFRFAPDREVTAAIIAELISNAQRALRWYIERAQQGGPARGKRAAARRALRQVRTLLLQSGEDLFSKSWKEHLP